MRRSSAERRRAPLFAAVVLLAGGAPAAPCPGSDWEAVLAASREAARIVRNEAGRPDAELAGELAALGEPAIPVLFALRVGLPLPTDPAGGEAAGDGALRGPAAELALAALRGLPHEPVDAFLLDVAARADEPRRALEVVRIAGELGRASSLDLLAGVSCALPRELQGHPVAAGTLRGAIAAVLAAGEVAPARLRRFVREVAPAFAPVALETLCEALREERFELWVDAFGRSGALDRALVAEIELRPPASEAAYERVARPLRELARASDRALRLAVVRALRRYPSLDTANVLIDRLEDRDGDVREHALRSLRELSGVTLDAGAPAWRAWRDDEQRWRVESWPRLEEELAAAPPAAALRLLAELAVKKVHARPLAEAIGRFLDHPRPELRLAACDALARLGTPACVERLAAARNDPDVQVRARADRLLGKKGART